MEAKVRYKAYKAGKRWLYSAILFGSTVLTFGISHPIDAATPTEETVSLAQPAATTSLTDGSGTPKTAADSQPAQGAVSQSVTDPQAQGQASGQEMTGEQSMAASEAPKPAQAVAPSASQTSTNSENSPQAPTSATPAVSQTQPPRQTISEQPAVNTSASTPVQNQSREAATPTANQSVRPAAAATDSPRTAASPTAAANSETPATGTETPGAKDGDIVVPKEVKKAPDPVNTTNQPTVNPDTRTDVPETNTYPNSIFHQVPVYVGGKLVNPPKQNAVIAGTVISADIGMISPRDYIDPQHDNEVITMGYYHGSSAWMTGLTTDNQTLYLYRTDSQGKIIDTKEVATPNSPDFDPNWGYRADGISFYWKYGAFQMERQDGASSVPPLQYVKDIPVKYVDTFGNEIATTESVSGYMNTYVDAPVKEIPGYRLIKVPFQNSEHKFLINNLSETTPSSEWKVERQSNYVEKHYRILDNQNTQEIYLIFYYPANAVPFTGPKKVSPTYVVKAAPFGSLGFDFSQSLVRAYATTEMPTPVGNPLIFTYEPIKTYHLTINYLK